MKLTTAQKFLLFDAFRRNEMFERNHDRHELAKPLNMRWIGLGTASVYRPAMEAGLMTWAASVPQKRCMGWVRLTDLGVAALKELADDFKESLDRAKANGYTKTILENYQLAGGFVSGD